jgi:hypothetical protein
MDLVELRNITNNKNKEQRMIIDLSTIFKSKKSVQLENIYRELCQVSKKYTDITIDDLVAYPGNGVYFFWTDWEKDNPCCVCNSKRLLYVGAATSRCFAERIPSHFDLRETGWMNSLLRGYRKNVVKSNDKLRKIYTSLKDRLYLSALHFDEKFLNKNFFPCTVGSHTFKSYQYWDDERHKTVVRNGKSNTYHPDWKAALKGKINATVG